MARIRGTPPGNVNYDWDHQVKPDVRMGANDNQNMPQGVIMRPFPRTSDFKSGITNRWERDTEVLSGIPENNA